MLRRISFFLGLVLTLHCPLHAIIQVPITLEFAKTPEELTWGLMQRPYLPHNHGMLFIYPKPIKISIWMFNSLIDLSVAFLDKNGVIRQINELKAYPLKMDPTRPVTSLKQLTQYSINDPTIQFFEKRKVTSTFPASFALEMNAHWFQENNVTIGDIVQWNENTGSGIVIHP